ncbi:hypothetical protein [Saccharopolyspora hattusasensis]|uniref:hypothetical protein n=1 Tax=Saccharopolyspora hattusasensis TaxID=1128679 RepID=UPI003D96AAE9
MERSEEQELMTSRIQFDPLEPATLADPYPVYAELREKSPVFWHEEMQSWTVTRYRKCLRVLRDHERFAQVWRRVGRSEPFRVTVGCFV